MKQPQHNKSLPLSLTRAAVPDGAPAESSDSSESYPSQSALRMTRDAIARWRGAPLPSGSLPRDNTFISPQARWLAEAHAGLSHWIEGGGFAQGEQGSVAAELLPPLPGPVMYRLPLTPRADEHAGTERACRLN